MCMLVVVKIVFSITLKLFPKEEEVDAFNQNKLFHIF